MRIGICEFTTMRASFEEDLDAYAAAGVQGIGVCEFKLPSDGARLLRESGMRATAAIAETGYDGWYDVEIFSDDSFPDSLWLEDRYELALRARESMERLL